MECMNGHKTNEIANFCPICGTTSFRPDVASEQSPSLIDNAAPQAPAKETKGSVGKGAVLITIAVLIAAAVIAIVIANNKNSTQTITPRTTVPVAKATGPSLSYMQHSSLTDFNKRESEHGTESNCAYDPKKWVPGYRFTCFIYDSASNGIGTVVITSTSSATASEYTWNESFSLS